MKTKCSTKYVINKICYLHIVIFTIRHWGQMKLTLHHTNDMNCCVGTQRHSKLLAKYTQMITTDLSPVHTSNNVEATLSSATSQTILSTKSTVASTLLPFWQQCRKVRPFDKVETNWTCSLCFDFVERTKFYDKLVRHCCRFWQQSRMLLRRSWTLLRYFCWCGRGFRLIH